ncbi:unnamed protein product [Calypogeia fissa]
MAMFGSSSPFGASSSSPFGGAATSSNPFGTPAQNNPFGGNQSSNPFGAKPFGSSPFGGQGGGSLFGSGTATGVFGATQQPAFGGTTSAFGASSTAPTFGSTATPFGSGTPAFGQKPTTSFGGFGATPAQANPFGTFGQTQPAFGSQPFGSTPPAFGATSSPAFGSTATPAFGTSSTPAFGASSTPAFGATTSSPFGSSAPAFGSTSVFGQSTPAFGASSSPAFGSTPFGSATTAFGAPQSGSAFGSTPTASFGATSFGASFGGQRVGSRVVPYAVTNDTDVGVGGQVGKFMSISAMPAYNTKSPEELRWEDYQAGDKGGSNQAGQQPATGGIFGTTPQSPFGGAPTGGFGQQPSTPNPFATTPTSGIFGGQKPTTGFGAASTPAFGSTPAPAFGQTPSPFGQTQSPFAAPSTMSAFGQASAPAFGSTPSPFGGSTGAGFGTNTFGSTPLGTSVFGASTPGFTGSAFSTLNTPSNVGTSSPFGSTSFFGQSQPAGSLFGSPLSQGFGASTPAFGATSTPAFGGSNIFNSGTSSIFSQTKSAGLTQSSTPSPFSAFGQTTPGQASFSFPNFQASQPAGNNMFNSSSFGQNAFAQTQPTNNLMMAMPQPVTNPFGTLPAMPQMSIGRSAGSGPSVQYGISTMPVSDKPTQVRTTSLLTPRHITQRSKIRMHARRYNPKKDTPKVSFFSDGEETPTTPKADVLFVPRENPRALFIRHTDQTPTIPPIKGTPDPRDIATPVQRNGAEVENHEPSTSPVTSPGGSESPMESWPSPDFVDGNNQTTPLPSKAVDKSPPLKPGSKMNGVREEHNHRGNGYISITGHRAGEAAIAYEHGADIEALMPKLRHSDYFTEPRIQELAAKERAEPGYCRRVHDFVVGRRGYGSVKFLGDTDVRRLDLEGIIQFNKCEVLVYMDESKKPPAGQGLNKPAEVTLLNVKSVDKKTGQHFTEGPEIEKFEKRLKRKTEEQGAEFISFDAVKGEWKFQVKHFSRYGLDDSDEEEVLQSVPAKAIALLGTDMMEGVEGDMFESPADLRHKSPEIGEETVDIDEEEVVRSGEVHSSVPQAALPHSLPSQLRLDPLKMQQMRALFFPLGEEAEDPSAVGFSGKPRSSYTRQSEVFTQTYGKAHKDVSEEGVRSAWPRRSPWKGGPTKQMRLTPHTSWKPSVPHSPAQTESQSKHKFQVSDLSLSPPENRPMLALQNGEGAGSIKDTDVGFAIEFDKLSESATARRYDHIVDAGLFFGRSFRVGWGPNGVFVHSGARTGTDTENVVLSSRLHIEKVALDSTVRGGDHKVLDELVELQFVSPLKLHMSMSKVVESVRQPAIGEFKLRNVVCNQSDLSGICDEYEDLIQKQHAVKGVPDDSQLTLRHQVIVWQLLDVLFSNILPAQDSKEEQKDPGDFSKVDTLGASIDPVELLLRRAEFSRWLQTSVSHVVQDDLQRVEHKNEDDMREIFILLTGRKVDAAVMKATFRGDIRLACLLSQAGASVKSRSDIAIQLSVWGSEGLDYSLIENERMSVYKLLAGDIWGALENHYLDWKRFLGLIMWYQLGPDTDLSVIINTYQQFITENKTFLPIPMYVEEGDDNRPSHVDTYDTSYYLMLLHASKEKEMKMDDVKKMFSSASTTFDKLDHRMAWHQQGFLQAVGVLEPLHLHELHMNFVAQLLAVGLCHWAIYVVLHMPVMVEYPGFHAKVIREILSQYCETWSKSEMQKHFLEQELGIPTKWLHEALAVYYHYVGDSKQELEHLIRSLQWNRAQTLFMTTVSALLFIDSEHSEVWKLASQLEMNAAELENWDLGAAIYFDFYNLKTSLEDDDDVMDDLDTLEKKTAGCKAFFARLKDSERLWKKKASKYLRIAYSQMADELASLLLVETHAKALDASEELKGFDAVLDAPVPEHIHACRIQGAVSAFTSWLSETVV